jgi:predicted permease
MIYFGGIKMKLFSKKPDERQHIEAMEVTSASFWIAFFGLTIAILVQSIVHNGDFSYVAGEFIVLMVVAVYASVGFYKRGIWDNLTEPGWKTYLVYSLVLSAILSLPIPVANLLSGGSPISGSVILFLQFFAVCFPLGYIALALTGRVTKHRQSKLAEKFSDDCPDQQ